MVYIVSSKVIADQLREQVQYKLKFLMEKTHLQPALAIIRNADADKESMYFTNKVIDDCEDMNINTCLYQITNDTTSQELINMVRSVSLYPVNGILIQNHITDNPNAYKRIVQAVPENKLIDSPRSEICVVSSIIDTLHHYLNDLTSKHVTIINRSEYIGRPLMIELLNYGCTVTVCHSLTLESDMEKILENSDIIIDASSTELPYTKYRLKDNAFIVDINGIITRVVRDYPDLYSDYDVTICNHIGSLTRVKVLEQLVTNFWDDCITKEITSI